MEFQSLKPSDYEKTDILMAKKAIIIALMSFLVPFLGFVLLINSSLAKIYYNNIIVHSILLIVICSIAATMSIFTYRAYAKFKNIRIFITSCFFYTLFIFFLLHSVFVHKFYFVSEESFDIAEHIGMFFASLISLIFILPLERLTDIVYKRRKLILFVLTILFFGFIASLLIFVSFVRLLSFYLDFFILFTGIFLLLSAIFLIRRYSATWHGALIYLIATLSIFINAAIIPFFYNEWNVLWWYFHFVILAGLIVVLSGIFANPEKFKYYKSAKHEIQT